MIPATLAGVWAAQAAVKYPAAWYPASPFTGPAHYFLVVYKAPDGTIRAFIRNPEFNAGAAIGSTADLPAPAPDGTIAVAKASINGDTLHFHRASPAEMRWFYPRPSTAWQYRAPADLGDGWAVGTLASAGMDERPIDAFMASIVSLRSPTLRSPYIQSVAIERRGKLVLDEYFYGFTPQTPHDVRSAGKSVTTLILGRAIEDTHSFAPDSRVLDLLTSYKPVKNDDARKDRMTVADLMTMASGFACDDNDDTSPGNEGTIQSQPAGTDWYRYTLDLPIIHEPGSYAVYCTAGINLLGAIVARETHTALTDYFYDHFAAPMQFGTYAMWLQPAPASEAYMGGGDYFRPRDFLKFGELLLDGGVWNGRRIVNADWIRESIVPRSAPVNEGDKYGYGWHLTTVTVDGQAYEVVNAGGNGGQLLIAVPKLDLAIMVTAGNYMQFPVWRAFLPEITTAAIRSCNSPGARTGNQAGN